MMKCEPNLREERAWADQEEYHSLRASVRQRLGLPDTMRTNDMLDELFELGYDQGSTMEAEFPTE